MMPRPSANECVARRCRCVFFYLFTFLFRSLRALFLTSPSCSSLCHTSRRPPCPSPQPSSATRRHLLPPLALGHVPFPVWSWGMTRRRLASCSGMCRSTTLNTSAPFQSFFSGSFSALFHFSFFANRSPSLAGAQGPLSQTNVSRGPLFSNPRTQRACHLFVL